MSEVDNLYVTKNKIKEKDEKSFSFFVIFRL